MSESEAVWKALKSCWSDEVYLKELAGRFWRLTLQVSRGSARTTLGFADSFDSPTAPQSVSDMDQQHGTEVCAPVERLQRQPLGLVGRRRLFQSNLLRRRSQSSQSSSRSPVFPSFELTSQSHLAALFLWFSPRHPRTWRRSDRGVDPPPAYRSHRRLATRGEEDPRALRVDYQLSSAGSRGRRCASRGFSFRCVSTSPSLDGDGMLTSSSCDNNSHHPHLPHQPHLPDLLPLLPNHHHPRQALR